MNTVWKLLGLGIALSINFSGCVPAIFGDRYEDDVPKLRITEEEKQILREFFEANGRPDVSLDREAFVRTNDSMRVDTLIISSFPFDSLIISSSFLQLSNLKYIGISNTRFSDVPEEFASLPSLKELYINASPFQAITEHILTITSLESLSLLDCPVKHIPTGISRLVNLQKLTVSFADLVSISPEIVDLSNLDTLRLGYNQINSLPREILNMNYSEFFIFENNLCTLDSAEVAWLSQYSHWDRQNCD